MALEIDREKHTKKVSTAMHQKIVYSDAARQLSFTLCRSKHVMFVECDGLGPQ
jgi:hypothetical protein